MKPINPYLNFTGYTEEAFNFYKSVLGGEFAIIQRFKDTPEAGNAYGDNGDKLMHISLVLPNGNVLMGTDALDSMGHHITMGSNINLSITAESKEEADNIFNGLAAGANVSTPMSMAFWGAYYGMLTDKYGIGWMVSFEGK